MQFSPRHFALIPAAGIGARMDAHCPKQYLSVAGKPMLMHVLDTFASCKAIAHTFVVVGEADEYIAQLLDSAGHLLGSVTVVRNGGATRRQSVLNGLNFMCDIADDEDWVLVHDAARPGLTCDLIDRLVQSLRSDAVGGLLALPVVDTIKRSGTDGRVNETVPRERLWAAQTPQMFRYQRLRHALQENADVTDEAGAIELLGLNPKLVEGSPRNFKITRPGDIALAERYLKESNE